MRPDTEALPTIATRSMRCACALAALIVAGCAAPPPTGSAPSAPPVEAPKPPAPPTSSANPPANVNLQGFPLSYRQGYADGCASIGTAEQKDATRFKSDGQYRTGWQDGYAVCKKR